LERKAQTVLISAAPRGPSLLNLQVGRARLADVRLGMNVVSALSAVVPFITGLPT
jgi:hypothetical protein